MWEWSFHLSKWGMCPVSKGCQIGECFSCKMQLWIPSAAAPFSAAHSTKSALWWWIYTCDVVKPKDSLVEQEYNTLLTKWAYWLKSEKNQKIRRLTLFHTNFSLSALLPCLCRTQHVYILVSYLKVYKGVVLAMGARVIAAFIQAKCFQQVLVKEESQTVTNSSVALL